LLNDLEGMGILCLVDRAQLALYATAWGEFVECTRKIGEDGFSVNGSAGTPVLNPLVRVRQNAIDVMIRIAGQFGFSPVSRERISGAEEQEPEDDFFQRFLRGARGGDEDNS
jgi:P27 family predicted phage terminase small subunit